MNAAPNFCDSSSLKRCIAVRATLYYVLGLLLSRKWRCCRVKTMVSSATSTNAAAEQNFFPCTRQQPRVHALYHVLSTFYCKIFTFNKSPFLLFLPKSVEFNSYVTVLITDLSYCAVTLSYPRIQMRWSLDLMYRDLVPRLAEFSSEGRKGGAVADYKV